MRIHIATDHAAFELKNYLVEQLKAAGYEVVDHGAKTFDADDDYPDFITPCAQAVAKEGAMGIIFGGSGNGEQIMANKVKGIRAILAYNTDIARVGREHNDANIISIGGRMQSPAEAWEMVQVFLTTPFSNEARHQRRIDKISAYENARN